MRFQVDAGYLSVRNGAQFPLNALIELADAVGASLEFGCQFGHDILTVSDTDGPVVEELLIESKILYQVEGRDTMWQNVRAHHAIPM